MQYLQVVQCCSIFIICRITFWMILDDVQCTFTKSFYKIVPQIGTVFHPNQNRTSSLQRSCPSAPCVTRWFCCNNLVVVRDAPWMWKSYGRSWRSSSQPIASRTCKGAAGDGIWWEDLGIAVLKMCFVSSVCVCVKIIGDLKKKSICFPDKINAFWWVFWWSQWWFGQIRFNGLMA